MNKAEIGNYTFDYVNELGSNIDGTDWGCVSFYTDNGSIEVVPEDYETMTNYSDEPNYFNSESGNVGYKSQVNEYVTFVDSTVRYTDSDGNTVSENEFLNLNPQINPQDIPEIIQEIKHLTESFFKDWFLTVN